ncbi:hypothetical protein [Alkaliphilus serpentinus]|uniref:Uncharacterized protein n=1 Tax=Alkaliphilus serpentinus TaxID=1482731 RepID=A0A833HQQ2_9FIRM|nr:hypothetical protein [Alkaliphilus serpentinus]KAB3531356.1 hypothetical protein F8153_04035 [Alkaliphilus serpentinus]
MSIKPVDYHLTYANSIKESKIKQDDVNRFKDTNQFLQQKINQDTEKKLHRPENTEKSNKKNIGREENKKGKGSYQGKKRREGQNSASHNQENKPKTKSGIGDKIDIMI